MKEKIVLKRCLALLLAIALVISGLTIPERKATAAGEVTETEETTEATSSATNISGDATSDDTTAEAKIGEAYFTTLKNALAAAKDANGNVTIELLQNVTDTGNFDILNTSGYAVTIDGNGHIITGENGNNTIRIGTGTTADKGVGAVELRNMTIDQKNRGAAIQVNYPTTVDVTDVTINAVNPTTAGAMYALVNLNTNDTGTTLTTLNMTKVIVNMDVTYTSKGSNWAIVRTGNPDTAATEETPDKTVAITLTECTLDSKDSVQRYGVMIMQGTKGTVAINGGTIHTNDVLPIVNNSTFCTITKTKCKLNCESYAAEIDGTPYTSFNVDVADDESTTDVDETVTSALTAAKNASENVTVELLQDITGTGNFDVLNTSGYAVAIDGNGHTITGENGNNTIRVGTGTTVAKGVGAVELKNLTIEQKNRGAAIQVNYPTTVDVTDVTINAVNPTSEGAMYALINLNTNDTGTTLTTLNMTEVIVNMDVTYTSKGSNWAIVRTGNPDTSATEEAPDKTVAITLTECTLDAKDSVQRYGVLVMQGTKGTVTINGGTIHTNDVLPIVNNSTFCTVTKTKCKLNCESYAAEINGTPYASFNVDVADDESTTDVDETVKSALTAAATGDTIELLQDINITTQSIKKGIIVDGNEHTITSTGGTANNAITIDTASINVEFKNLKFVHKNFGTAFKVNKIGVTLNLTDVDIDATKPDNSDSNYRYALINTDFTDTAEEMTPATLNLTRVDVTMVSEKVGNDDYSAIIRTGNGSSATDATRGTKTVEINLDECNFDTTGATGRHGIVVMDTTTANINLTNSDIKTADVAAIKSYSTIEVIQNVVFDDDCELTSNTEAYAEEPIEGYTAQVGNTVYMLFEDALTAATEAKEDVELKLLKSVTIGAYVTLQNENGKKITFNGNGRHTISTSVSNAFRVYTDVEFKNMTINYSGTRSVIRTEAAVNVSLTNVIMNCENNNYAYGLINTLGTTSDEEKIVLNLSNVDVTMNVTTTGTTVGTHAIIRTGNPTKEDDNQDKTVEINIKDGCDLNASASADVHDIMVANGTTAIIDIQDSTLTTKNVVPIYDGNAETAATITKTNCTMNMADAVAQIGENQYTDFLSALDDANASEEAVTIELLKDIEISSVASINNTNGKDITIDGNNHKVTTSTVNNTIRVQYAGNVEFKNMTIIHTASQCTIRIEAAANVSITNVDIQCSTDNYQYGLISTLTETGEGEKVVLTLTDVDVTMSTTLAEDNTTNPSVIRTGNNNQEKTVDIILTDCEWDLTSASGVRGILGMNDTTANITMTNSTIHTADVEAIKATASTSQTVVMDNQCKLTSDNSATISGYEAQIGNTVYLVFKDALAAANEAEEAVTIELLSDVTVTYNYYIGNVNGKTITVEGNDKIVTTAGAKYNHAFRVNQACSVVFKDMTIIHNNRGSVIQVDENTAGATLTLTDVEIQAVNPENTYTDSNNVTYENIYSYTLINIHSSSTLNMTRVNATMTVATEGWDDYLAILRTGNVNQEKTVEININDCNFNTTGASKRSGIIIMKTTNATLNVTDTNISTKDAGAIIDYSGNATITKTFSEKDATKEGYTTYSSADYVAQIGGTMYTDFATALTDANAASEDVVIELLQDITVTAHNIGNTKGYSITIDGNNHKVTSAGEGNNHAFTINKVCAVEFKNMTFVHNNRGSVIQTGATTAVGATVTLTDVIIQAINPSNSYTDSNDVTYENIYSYALINMMADSTLNLTRVDVTMAVNTDSLGDGKSAAIIRTGNNNTDADKAVTINLIDCNLDSTGAVGRSGILIYDAVVEINLVDTTIKTPNEEYCAAIQGYGDLTRMATISMRGDCLLESGGSTAASDTIKNLDGDSGITDGCTWTYKKYNNVTAFRTEDGLEAPSTVPTGYIFAGWYTDAACTAEYALEETDTTTTSAYAKFVPEHVIDVKAQISANLLDGVSDSEKGAIRFVTTVDSLDYQEVGFDYIISNSGTELLSGTKKSNVVYRKLYAVGTKDGGTLNYIPGFTFCAESEYFKAVTFKNISSSLFDAEITVRPFWITLDGTKVYGASVTKTVNQGIESSDSEGNVNSDSESAESTYTNRVVLVSDMHYTTSLEKSVYDDENWSVKAWLAGTLPNASYAAGSAFGYTQEQKLQAILDDINGLGANATIDSVMILGDITLDDYGYRNLVDNYLDDFKANFIDKLTYPSYTIAGNHDSYTNDEWKSVIGTDRQYSVEIGNAVFIMLDTFEAIHATSASGSTYVGVDIDFLKTELANVDADKTIFLCSHYYQEGRDADNDAALKELIAGDERIVCMFRGHTHKNTALTPDSLAGISLIDIGGYAYNGQKEDDGTYDFNTFDESWAWGYQVLEWNDEEVHLYHVKSARSYTDSDGIVHNYEGAIEDDIVIKIKK